MLAPGGVVAYDTVNRSVPSALIYLFGFQLFPPTRIVARGRYSWGRFRRPSELSEALERRGLRNQDVTAFHPRSPVALVRAVLRAKKGAIDDGEIARLVGWRLAESNERIDATYLGFAVKLREAAP